MSTFVYSSCDKLELFGYADYDFAGSLEECFNLAGGAISWKSVKQTITTLSTIKREFVACYETTV